MKWINSSKTQTMQLIHYDTNLNSPITIEEIEFIILKLPKNKSPPRDVLTEDSYLFKNQLTLILYNIFPKIGGNTCLNYLMKLSVLKPNQTRIVQKKKTLD